MRPVVPDVPVHGRVGGARGTRKGAGSCLLAILARLVDSRLVTDDNMAPEWSEPLNLPIVSTQSPRRVVGF